MHLPVHFLFRIVRSPSKLPDLPDIPSFIGDYANTYKVSREVILRKCLDKRLIEKTDYEFYVQQWKDDWKKSKPKANKGGGGNYHRNQFVYLGPKYTRLAFQQYYQHRINEYELANYLGVKLPALNVLEESVIK